MLSNDQRDALSQAVCTQYDPDIWHEDATEEQAIDLCRTGGPGGGPCPALQVCLDIATDPSNHVFTRTGVWGGVNSHRRDRIRARRLRGVDRYQSVTFTTTNRRTPVQQSSL